MVSKVGLDQMASAYLGDTDPRTPLASPLFAPIWPVCLPCESR